MKNKNLSKPDDISIHPCVNVQGNRVSYDRKNGYVYDLGGKVITAPRKRKGPSKQEVKKYRLKRDRSGAWLNPQGVDVLNLFSPS